MKFKFLNNIKTYHIIIFIFILTFIPRFIFLIDYIKSPFFSGNIIDAKFHQKWAEDIINGDIFSFKQGDVLYKAPLYPYFLALCFKIFGENYFIIRIIQIILGSLTSILLYLISRKYLNKWLALTSALLYSFYFVTIYFDNAIEIPVLSNFFTLLSFYLLIKRKKIINIISSGLTLGFSITALPSNILLVPLYILIIYFYKQKELKLILLFLIFCIVIIMPITVRNYIKSGKFVLICTNKGINLYLGNNENFEETMTIKPGLEWSRFVNKNISEDGIKKKYYESDKIFSSRIESDSYWNEKVYKFIKTHPFTFILNIIKKFFMYFGQYEMMRNEDVYHQWSYTILKYLPFLNLTVLFPLSLTGSVFYFKKFKKKWDIYIFLFILIIPNILFFVTARYRYFSLSIWSIFASYAMFYLYRQIILKNIMYLLIFILIFAFSFTLVFSNLFVIKNNPAVKYIYAGNASQNTGNYKKAIENYNVALSYIDKINMKFDLYTKAEIYYHKANSNLSLGEKKAALADINKALELLPDYGDAIFIKGLILFLNNKYEDVINLLISIQEGTSFTNYDNFSKALLLLESALIESKTDINELNKFIKITKFNLFKSRLIDYQGTIFLREGQVIEAKKLFEKAIELDGINMSAKIHFKDISKIK